MARTAQAEAARTKKRALVATQTITRAMAATHSSTNEPTDQQNLTPTTTTRIWTRLYLMKWSTPTKTASDTKHTKGTRKSRSDLKILLSSRLMTLARRRERYMLLMMGVKKMMEAVGC